MVVNGESGLTLRERTGHSDHPLCSHCSTWGQFSQCASSEYPRLCPCQDQWQPPGGPYVA